MAKKPTDKQRLDWLQRNQASANRTGGEWRVHDSPYFVKTGRTLRKAIDKAMKASGK